ncbi:MAG: PAS domain-containing sensor histidine kinase [Bacteroidales bacterium]|nr:PAS domain-containing sensor histidine kinase [Bacteroidales bacterium]
MFLSRLKIQDKFEKAIFAFDRKGTLFFTSGFQRLFANSANDLMYKNYLNIFAAEYTNTIKKELKKLTDKNKTTHLTIKLNNDSKTKCILTLSILFYETGKHIGYIGELELDKDEQKKCIEKAESSYKEFLDNIPIGIYRTTIDGKLIFANKQLLKIFNYANKYDIKDVAETFVDKDYRKQKLKQWIEQGEYSDEFQIKTSDNRIVYVRDAGHLVTENGKPMYFDGALEDITEKKVLEKKLKESNTSKNKFFSILSHDLKGAFGQFIGATDLILDEINNFDKEQIENIIQLLNEQANRSYKLLENLLDWSKSQEGILKFQPEPINLSALIKEIVEYYNQAAKKKSINLYSELKDSLIVYADKYMLSTVLRNLISNAVKFTPKGGSVVISACELIDTENYRNKVLEISVKDTGVGIEKERIEHLFNMEGNYSTKGTGGEIGTGLGLILCKEFVEKHGGKIWVESETGKGSTFKFTIP